MSEQTQIAMTTAQQTYLLRYATRLGLDAREYMERIQTKVGLILGKYNSKTPTPALMDKIIRQVHDEAQAELTAYANHLKQGHADVISPTLAASKDVLETTTSAAAIATPKVAEVRTAARLTPVQVGEKSYMTYTNFLANFVRNNTQAIDAAVMVGFGAGQTIPEITQAILSQIKFTGRKVGDGVLDKAYRSAKQIAITGTNHYGNASRVAFGEANKKIVKAYRSIGVLDSRTSQQCRFWDGKVMTSDNPKFVAFTPPRHPNCRSSLSYVVDPKYQIDRDGAERASAFTRDGERDPRPMDANKNYYETIKNFNAADQNEILGPTLGKAFRKGLKDGTLSPNQFARMTVDSLGNPLTITEMTKSNTRLGNILRSQLNNG